jgi:hypothetical protein
MANIKKISTATVGNKPTLKQLVEFAEKGIDFPVMRVVGMAVKTKVGESSYGEYTALLGEFAAWPLNLDGSIQADGAVRAATCFLPDIALVPILTTLAGGAMSVQFAVDVKARVIPEEKKKPGSSPYEYTFEHVLPPSSESPMERLLASVAAAQLPGVAVNVEKLADAPAPAPAPEAAPSKGKGK